MGCLCESKNNEKENQKKEVKKFFFEINSGDDEAEKNIFNKNINIKDKMNNQQKNNYENNLIKNKNDNKLSLNDSKNNNNDKKKFNDKSRMDNYTIDYSRLIGKGAFGQIYLGTDKKTQKSVALKIEKKSIGFSYLLNEYKNYRKLKGYKHIPIIYDCFQDNDNNYMVMELLGTTLESIFRKYNKKFSLSTVLNIGIRILEIIEFIHSKNIIHRDLKPDCFLVGKKDESKIYIIDFGFAVNYIEPKLGLHYPLKQDKFVGNYKFSSNNSMLLGYNKSRRDDIEAIAYMLIYFLKGSLPWEAGKNKDEVQDIRRKTTIYNLCMDIPEEIRTFLSYSWKLKFIEKPDYKYLRNLLINCSKNNNISLTKNNYDWIVNENIEFAETKTFVTVSNKTFMTLSAINNSFIERQDRKIIEANYIKNKKAFNLNNILRTKGFEGLSEEEYETYFTLTKVINDFETQEDYLAHRFVDDNYLKGVFNFVPTNDILYNLSKIKEQIGTVKIEKGFMSCFMTDNHIIKRNVKLEIKIPKGTNAYITQNKEESEIILGCNTEYQIMDAKIVNNIIQIGISILNNKKSFISFD